MSKKKKKKGCLEWLAMVVDMGDTFAFVKCLLIVILLSVHWRSVNISLKTNITSMQLVSNKPLNMWTWMEIQMYIQYIWCEDQAHSHRLTIIQKSSSPLVMFYGFVSGKKKKKKISNLLKRMLSFVTEGHGLIPSHVTATLCDLGNLVRSISGGVNPAASPTPQTDIAAHTEFPQQRIWCSQVRLKNRWELVSEFISFALELIKFAVMNQSLNVMDWISITPCKCVI